MNDHRILLPAVSHLLLRILKNKKIQIKVEQFLKILYSDVNNFFVNSQENDFSNLILLFYSLSYKLIISL